MILLGLLALAMTVVMVIRHRYLGIKVAASSAGVLAFVLLPLLLFRLMPGDIIVTWINVYLTVYLIAVSIISLLEPSDLY